jgi:methylthioxylose transferase
MIRPSRRPPRNLLASIFRAPRPSSGAPTAVKIGPMRYRLVMMILAQAALVAGLALALRLGVMPLGVRGEWEWPRVPVGPMPIDLALATAGLAAYASFVALGFRALSGRTSRRLEAACLTGLLGGAVAIQATLMSGAPLGYGLTKWVTLHNPGSNGYYTVAKAQIDDPWRFLAGYPDWIRRQDALHVGTHPPGLFLASHAALRAMESRPKLARFVVDHLPWSVAEGFRQVVGGLPLADRAALALTGGLVLLACAGTVVPLYLLARSSLSAPEAWVAASLWPLVPSAILFQPTADTAFPLLSTSALALAAHAGRSGPRRGYLLAAVAGLVLALGMAFTLAFLPVGLVAAILLAGARGPALRRGALSIVATGVGFLGATLAAWAVTGANPFVVWWWNGRNHARFYEEYARSYASWVVANPIEMTLALGLAASAWALIGLLAPRRAPRAAWAALAVLLVLNFSGRNLSEVARLWLPFMPPLLTATGPGLARLGGGPKTLAASVMLQGAQTLILQSAIQVVYPT